MTDCPSQTDQAQRRGQRLPRRRIAPVVGGVRRSERIGGTHEPLRLILACGFSSPGSAGRSVVT